MKYPIRGGIFKRIEIRCWCQNKEKTGGILMTLDERCAEFTGIGALSTHE